MKKLLRKLIILIVIVCIFLLIQKNTTRLSTSTQTGNVETWAIGTWIDLTNCVSYFDGCNNCMVMSGEVTACTKMYCETPSEPKCLQYDTGSEQNISGQEKTVATTDVYIVKTEQGNTIPWENIYVYDKSGNKIFSLIATNDPSLQFFSAIAGDYLIVDYWTSPDIRSFMIYNIKRQAKTFESLYSAHNGENWGVSNLSVAWNKVSFATLVFSKRNFDGKRQIPQPKVLPTCPTTQWIDNWGYSEIREFNLDTKQLEKTWKVVCTYLQ